MDEVEKTFIQSILRQSSTVSKSMAGENASKYTGLQNEKTQQILQNIAKDSPKGATGNTPVAPQGGFENNQLQPLEITAEMINEIRELEGDVLLPENVGRGDVMGNPSSVKSVVENNEQVVDKNQLEFNFDKISVDDVHEQYDKIITLIGKLQKELKTIKALVETK